MRLLATLLVIPLLAAVPTAAAACTTQEIVYVGPPADTRVVLTTCDANAQYGHSGDGIGSRTVCTPEGIPEVRVAGQQVPGTGDARVCQAVQGPPAPSGGGDYQGVHFCLFSCAVIGADEDYLLCLTYGAARLVDPYFYCHLSTP